MNFKHLIIKSLRIISSLYAYIYYIFILKYIKYEIYYGYL